MPRLKRQIVLWGIRSDDSSTPRCCCGLPEIFEKRAGHAEAVKNKQKMLLFQAEPLVKPNGAVRSHRYSPGKCLAIPGMLDAKKTDAILRRLPFFHRLDRPVTLWDPLIEGVEFVVSESIGRGQMRGADRPIQGTFLLLTPTFLRL